MKTLVLDVHFLTGRYHGMEWPPAPMRLLQAIVAGSHTTSHPALRWFERQEAPMILAEPEPHIQSLTQYVPANNRKDTEAKVAKMTSERRVSKNVSYVYEIAHETDEALASQMAEMALKVHTVGTGLDAVHIIGKIESEHQAIGEGRLRWLPWKHHLIPANSSILRTPIEGSLASTEAIFQFKLNRNLYSKGDAPRVPNAPPARYASIRYAPSEAARNFIWMPLILYVDNTLKNRWAGFAEDTVILAGMLRHALMRRADEFGVSDTFKDFIAGHPKQNRDPRVSYLPLPSIGHRNIDGLIRRALLLAPAERADWVEEWASLLDEPMPLFAEGETKSVAFAALTGEVDNVFERYLGIGFDWVTVTPMVLPGDYSRGMTLVRKLVSKAIREAGFAPEEIGDITASKVPMIAGAKHAHAYRRKVNGAMAYSYHVRVRFIRPVTGPIWIGRQRHQGLGTLACANPK